MSDLEMQIRNLKLRVPGETLDGRVFCEFNRMDDRGAEHQSSLVKNDSVRSASMESESTINSLSSNPRRGVAVSGWLVACVSMLIGGFVGNLMPSIVSWRSVDSEIADAEILDSESHELPVSAIDKSMSETEATEKSDRRWSSDAAGSSSRSANGVSGRRDIGSQIVESAWQSPVEAAVAWEQQTGQIFNVSNHVSDRRFDMCRECHRVGG